MKRGSEKGGKCKMKMEKGGKESGRKGKKEKMVSKRVKK
jgi:hypothetical protein